MGRSATRIVAAGFFPDTEYNLLYRLFSFFALEDSSGYYENGVRVQVIQQTQLGLAAVGSFAQESFVRLA